MTDGNSGNFIDTSLLKECYELAAQYEQLDAAKNILREKSKILGPVDGFGHGKGRAFVGETDMQIISEALHELSLEGYSASDNGRTNRYIPRVASLPDSGEKRFVMALLALREQTNETQRSQAIGQLTEALKFYPDDPRCLALIEILTKAGR